MSDKTAVSSPILTPEKPAPLKVDGSYFFTLSSYEAPSVEIYVPRVTEDEIEMGIEGLLSHHKVQRKDLTDAWVKENVASVTSIAELRQMLRRQGEVMNQQMIESSKGVKCAQELAKRLNQSVPDELIEMTLEMIKMSFADDLRRSGSSVEEFLSQNGRPAEGLDAVFMAQATSMAEQDAAIDAYAREKKIEVSSKEYPEILGISEDEAQEIVADAEKNGRAAQLKQAALRAKAIGALVAESHFSFHMETEAEAEARIADYRKIQSLEK